MPHITSPTAHRDLARLEQLKNYCLIHPSCCNINYVIVQRNHRYKNVELLSILSLSFVSTRHLKLLGDIFKILFQNYSFPNKSHKVAILLPDLPSPSIAYWYVCLGKGLPHHLKYQFFKSFKQINNTDFGICKVNILIISILSQIGAAQFQPSSKFTTAE